MTVACGKRGDPLPPLRPFPAAAEDLTIRQIGNRIQLEWRAPSQNTDGTVEKLELADVEVRRRLIDIAALIEAQTETPEMPETEELEEPEGPEGPTESEEPEGPEGSEELEEIASFIESAEPADPDAGELPSPASNVQPAASDVAEPEPDDTTTLTAAEALPDDGTVESEGASQSEDEDPKTPSIPVLVIPNFAPESRDIVTLESTVSGETNSFEEEVDPIWVGLRVEYAVVYTNQGGRRGERSSVVQIEPVAPLSSPGEPRLETGDGFVRVRFSAAPSPTAPTAEASAGVDVDESVPPESVPHYSVFRRAEASESYPNRPLNGQPITETDFVDRSVVFGVGSCYVVKSVTPPPVAEAPEALEMSGELSGLPELAGVTNELPVALADAVDALVPSQPADATATQTDAEAVAVVAGASDAPMVVVPQVPPLKNVALIESEPSPEVCLVPVDTFGPPAPTGLVAVRSGDDALLTWTEVGRPDVAGYLVYRSASSEGPFELLSERALRVPTYTDATVVAGETYHYGITAVDDAPAANESEMSELSDVTFAAR